MSTTYPEEFKALEEENERLEAENKELKESISQCHQAYHKTSVYHHKRIAELEAELDDYHNTEKFVLSDNCPTDEVHCGCVVILKKQIKDQNDQIRKLSHDLSCTDLY